MGNQLAHTYSCSLHLYIIWEPLAFRPPPCCSPVLLHLPVPYGSRQEVGILGPVGHGQFCGGHWWAVLTVWCGLYIAFGEFGVMCFECVSLVIAQEALRDLISVLFCDFGVKVLNQLCQTINVSMTWRNEREKTDIGGWRRMKEENRRGGWWWWWRWWWRWRWPLRRWWFK